MPSSWTRIAIAASSIGAPISCASSWPSATSLWASASVNRGVSKSPLNTTSGICARSVCFPNAGVAQHLEHHPRLDARLHRERHPLLHDDARRQRDRVVHELRHRPRTDRPDVADARPDSLEHGARQLEHVPVAADHHRERARLRADGAAAHRRVEHMRADRLDALRDLPHPRRRPRRQVGVHRARLQPEHDALRPERDLLDLVGAGQRREHDLRRARDLLRRRGPLCAHLAVLRRLRFVDVVHDERVPRLDQVARHRPAHIPQPDEPDAHSVSLRAPPSGAAATGYQPAPLLNENGERGRASRSAAPLPSSRHTSTGVHARLRHQPADVRLEREARGALRPAVGDDLVRVEVRVVVAGARRIEDCGGT